MADSESEFVYSLKQEERILYFMNLRRLGFCNEQDDPFLLDEDCMNNQWSASLELWPVVEFGNVYVYLIDCLGYSHQSLKAYKSLDGYSYFVNGWVHQLYVRQSSTGHSIVKGYVTGSQDASVAYTAWVGFNNGDGSIVTGHCTCMMGNESHGVCSHVAAIVFQVEAAPHLSCSKANTCLLCPYHQDTCAVKMEQHQETLVEAPDLDMSIEEDQMSSEEVNGQDAEDYEDELEQTKMVMDYRVVASSQVTDSRLDVRHGSSHLQDSQEDSDSDMPKERNETSNEDLASNSNPSNKTKNGSDIMMKVKDKPWCELCEKTFATNRILERHRKDQHSQQFETPLNSNHKKSADDEMKPKGKPNIIAESETLSCEICSSTFEAVHLLESHKEVHHKDEHSKLNNPAVEPPASKSGKSCNNDGKRLSRGEKKYEICSVCSEGFICHADLVKHMSKHTGVDKREQTFIFDKCSKTYRPREKNTLLAHQKSHTGELPSGKTSLRLNQKSLTCEVCNKVFSESSNLSKHMKIHTGERPYSCDKCGKGFIENNKLQEHKKTHIDRMPCNDTSSNENSSTVNEVSGKTQVEVSVSEIGINTDLEKSSYINPVKCSICGKVFRLPSSLVKHVRSCTGEKPYGCDECGRRFTQNIIFQKHKESHKMSHIDKNEKCDESFVSKSLFKVRVKKILGHGPPYECDICGKNFKRKNSVRNHMNHAHNGDNMFKCSRCEKRFCRRSTLLLHESQCHGKEKQLCNECGKTFFLRSSLTLHMRCHLDPSLWPYQCKQCDKHYYRSGELKTHIMIAHTKVKPHMCHECGKSFVHVSQLYNHMWKHSGEKPFTCNLCGKSFNERCNLKRHKRLHGEEKEFICSMCGRGFHQKSNLQQHMMQHTGEKPFECTECGTSFRQKSSLDYHLKRHEGKKDFQCTFCDQTFPAVCSLLKHMKSHGEGNKFKPYVCQVCGYSFTKSMYLTMHMNVHLKVDPKLALACTLDTADQFACKVCNKTFSSAVYRNIHEKRHSKRSLYSCDQCGKVLINKTSLENHIRTHTGERPFACQVCGKNFISQSGLIRHDKTHTGEKPFKCPTCGRFFGQTGALYSHMRTHTGEKPFKCIQCSQAFSEKRGMLKHLVKVHNVDLSTPQKDNIK